MSIILLMLACVEFTPHSFAVWNVTPQGVICEGNDVDEEKVVDSLERWTDISEEYRIDYVGWGTCEGDKPPENTIWFVEALDEELEDRSDRWADCGGCSVAAFTSYKTVDGEFSDEMWSATVHIKPYNRIEFVEHEIGHAFGWSHTSRDDGYSYGHIMSSHESDGLSDFGLEHYSDLMYYSE